MIKIKSDINLEHTITCGQIFRYVKQVDGSFTVILNDRVVNLKKENDYLIAKSNIEDNLEVVIRKYLDLDRDYNKINKEILSNDSSLDKIVKKCTGFKVVNSPIFETIISYIISQNNRVPQIQKSLNNMSEIYGEKVIFDGKEYYLFPSIDKLKNVSAEDFRKLKVGFRDKYIYEFVQNLVNNKIDLNLLNELNSEDAINYLMKNKGIGEKVASCILLFGYSRLDVFPIDTWVKKFMKDKYNIEGVNNIKKFIKNKYGNYSGLVIQYMFHYKRNINS